ncbi:hypothetical protein B0H19DRAFT_1197470 [Mycena capillaripes]|nr:hypothetical protein B0H19DRAFT_1197470 [Mycena capillaripes]
MDSRPNKLVGSNSQIAISPIHRIPAEILAEIFVFCVQNSRHRYDAEDGCWYPNYSYSVDDPPESPTALTHVCAFWRDVAVNTPRLWDFLTVYFPKTTPNGVESYTTSIVEALVRRSHPHPIAVVIGSADFNYGNGVPLDFLSTLASLPDFGDRVSTLSLQIAIPYFQYLLAKVPTPTFSRLEAVTLRLTVIRGWKLTLNDILEFFRLSPRLHSIGVDYRDLTAEILTPNFPWSNLTDLHLTSPLNYVEMRVILACCTSLRRCSFDGMITSFAPLRGDPTMHTLPALETLRLRTTTVGPSFVFFEVFMLPNLRHLDANLYGWTAEPLLSLQERSRFALTSLLLEHVEMDAEDFLRFLAAAPTLERLQLHDFPSEEVIAALRYHPGQTSMATLLLPALKELWIEVESEELAAGGDDLVDTLLSRWDLALRTDNAPAFARLTKVDLQVAGVPLSERAEAALHELGAAGLVEDHHRDLRVYYDS